MRRSTGYKEVTNERGGRNSFSKITRRPMTKEDFTNE